VLCPSGRFIEERLRPQGIETLAVDFQSASSIEQATRWLGRVDLIHAHPGPSRALALEAAAISGAPVVFTIHGAWFDGVQHYAQRLAAIVCVSEAVLDAVSPLCANHPAISCIPNGIDINRFDSPGNAVPEPGHIVVASRLDADKRVLIDTVIKLWEVQTKHAKPKALFFTIAGQGKQQSELEAAAQRFGIAVDFVGWQRPDELARLYAKASVVIASGRGAMEALAMGKPTLALASSGATEVFDPSHFMDAARCNYGGYGAKPPSSIVEVFDRLMLASSRTSTTFAAQASVFVRTHHDNLIVNQHILDIYDRVFDDK